MCKISKKISDRRKQLGLTLEDVGNAVGVSKTTVQRWESGLIKNMGRLVLSYSFRLWQRFIRQPSRFCYHERKFAFQILLEPQIGRRFNSAPPPGWKDVGIVVKSCRKCVLKKKLRLLVCKSHNPLCNLGNNTGDNCFKSKNKRPISLFAILVRQICYKHKA